MKRFVLFLVLGLVLGLPACRKDGKFRVNKNHRQVVGYSAQDLLSEKKYKSITIQIIYMTGYKPTEEAVDNLTSVIGERCRKSKGINVVYKEITAQGKSSYTLSDIKEIEDDERSEFTAHKNIAVTFIFLDGPSADDQGSAVVLGMAYYNTSLAIFEGTIHEYSDEFTEPERYKLETTVMNHELGHILGLVNVGSPMQSNHIDSEYGAHCNNPDCIMYWEAETGSIMGNLLGNNPIPTFDANCIADLQANGGR